MKAYHTLVVGDSGGGKTTYLREKHATANAASVFLTDKPSESNISGTRVRGRKALNTAVNRADSPTDVRAKWLGASYPDAVHTVREWAYDLRTHRGWSTQVIVDEADGALPDSESLSGSSSDNPLRDGLHGDRDRGIKYMLATQDPSDLYYPPVKQCRWFVWVGKAAPWHEGFARYFGFTDMRGELPAEEFEYVVFEKGSGMSWSVAHRGKTNKRYA